LFDVWIFEVLYLKKFKLNFPFELLVIVYFLRFYLFLKGLRESFSSFFFPLKTCRNIIFMWWLMLMLVDKSSRMTILIEKDKKR
jgi:hypothetical protein